MTKERRHNPLHTWLFGYAYMFLFSLRFSEAFWVIYLRSKGLSFAWIGLLETVFHIAALTGEIPTGWIADRFGRRISLLIGRILSIIAAFLVLRATGPGGFALAFIFSALGYTCNSGAYDALIYDELKADGKSDQYTRVMGALNAVYLIGAASAAFIGGLVAQRALSLLYVITIGVDVSAVLLLLPLRERAFRDAGQLVERPSLRRDMRLLLATLRRPELASLMLLWAIVSTLATSMRMYGQSYLRQAKLSLAGIGAVGTVGDLGAVLPSNFAYWLEERFGDRRPLFAGGVLMPVILILAGVIPVGRAWIWLAALIALLLAANILSETLYPLFSGAVNALVPSGQRATVLSSGSMLFSLMMMIVFPLIGLCGDHFGLGWGFCIAGIGGLLAVGAILALLHRKPLTGTAKAVQEE